MQIYEYEKNSELIYPGLSYKICGFLFYIHNQLGRFKKEKDYADAVEIILKENNIQYLREARTDNSLLAKRFGLYKLDFLVDNKVILELKSKTLLTKEDYYQLKRYLESKKLKLGLLVNFRDKYLKPKRIINHS